MNGIFYHNVRHQFGKDRKISSLTEIGSLFLVFTETSAADPGLDPNNTDLLLYV